MVDRTRILFFAHCDFLWTFDGRSPPFAASPLCNPHRHRSPNSPRHPLSRLALNIRQRERGKISFIDGILAHCDFCYPRFGHIGILGGSGRTQDELAEAACGKGDKWAGEKFVTGLDVLR